MRSRAKLTEGSEKKIITKMAGGMLFGFAAMSAFNAVDTYFVGHLGAMELAAMSFTFPVVMTINSIAVGLGIGLSSVVSRAIGAKDYDRVKRLTSDGLMLGLFLVILISFIGLISIKPLFTLLGASGQTLEEVRRYMFIWYLGMPFVVIPMTGNNVIRATGDTLTPSMIMTASFVVNVILDPLLIFGIGPFPHMGIAGAAIATVISRFVSVIFSLSILIFREKLISFEIPGWAAAVANWKQIAFVGIPAALVQVITPILLGVITRLLSHYGENVVAGFGSATRVEMIVMIIPMSLAAVMAPFAGQNWGAQKKDRIVRGLKFSSTVSLAWGVFVFAFCMIFSKPILAMFNPSPEIVQAGSNYLRIVSFSYGFFGILFISTQCLNALNKPLHSAVITLIKAFVINAPLAFIGAYYMHETGIFISAFIANIAGGIIGYSYIYTFLKKAS